MHWQFPTMLPCHCATVPEPNPRHKGAVLHSCQHWSHFLAASGLEHGKTDDDSMPQWASRPSQHTDDEPTTLVPEDTTQHAVLAPDIPLCKAR
jgi:hypothetical protein